MLIERLDSIVNKVQQNIILFLPLMLALGIALYFSLPFESDWFTGAFALFAALNIWHLLGRYDFALRPCLQLAALFLMVSAIGFTTAQFRTSYIKAPVLNEELRAVQINGVVERIDRLDGRKGSRVLIKDVTLDDFPPEKTPEKVRIRIIKDDILEAGQRIAVKGELLPPPPPVFPGGFDFQRWAFFQKIGAVGFAYYEPKIIFAADFTSEQPIERLRKKIEAHIYDVFGEANKTKAEIVTALITGRKTQMREDDKEALRDAGLAHIMAISGLHIGLIVSAVFFTVRLCLAAIPYCALYWPNKKVAAMAALSFATFYVLLSGASLPALRALIMMGVAMLAIVLDRSPISLRLVAFAALLILLILPESLLSVSFQLSFAAVASLVIFYERTRPWWQAQYAKQGFWRRVYLYGLGVVVTTLVSTVATAAPGLYHFNHFGVYGALSNLLAVPVLALFVMPFCLLSIITWPLGLDRVFFELAGHGAKFILDVAHYCADLPLAVIHKPYLGLAGFIIWTIWGGIIWMYSKNSRLALLSMTVIGIFALYMERQPNIIISSDFRLVVIKGEDSPHLAYGRSPRRFDRDFVADFYGVEAKRLVKDKHHKSCDPDGCRVEMAPNIFAEIIRFPENYIEACRRSAFVIADFPISALKDEQRRRGCRVPIISRFDTWHYGAYSVYLTKSGHAHINSLYSIDNYQRPWSQPSWR